MLSVVVAPGAATGTATEAISGSVERYEELPAISDRVPPEAALGRRIDRCHRRGWPPRVVEQFIRTIAPHPLLQHESVGRIRCGVFNGDLVGVKRVLERPSIERLRVGPSLRRAQDQHGPERPVRKASQRARRPARARIWAYAQSSAAHIERCTISGSSPLTSRAAYPRPAKYAGSSCGVRRANIVGPDSL